MHLPSAALAAIRRHAGAAAPAECCGALIGLLTERPPSSSSGPLTCEEMRVARVRPARNVAPSPTRYEVAPEEIAAAEVEAAEIGLEVVGYYHSHPASPPVPSPTDLEAAWPWYSYLIVDARTGELRAWRLAEDRSAFVEDDLRVFGDGGA